jgi:hypothetical protein
VDSRSGLGGSAGFYGGRGKKSGTRIIDRAGTRRRPEKG